MFSVIIPCYNARRWIGDTIRSALQSCAWPVEIVVIDDGSTDGGGELVAKEFPQVRLERTPNRGVSHARNLGTRLATGEWFVFLDADDLLPAGRLDRHGQLLAATGADVVYGAWQRLCPSPEDGFQPGETVCRPLGAAPEVELLTSFWCPPGAYTFRRGLVERVGGFRDTLPVIQDARFALDCALHGATFLHDPNVSCLYRTHTSGSVSTRNTAAFYRDCLTNAVEVRDWWEARGELTEERRGALVEVFDCVARTLCGVDAGCFAAACDQIERMGATSQIPGHAVTRLLAQVVGYRRAQSLAHPIRRWRRRLNTLLTGREKAGSESQGVSGNQRSRSTDE